MERQKIPVQNKKKMAVRTALLRTLYIGGALPLVILAPKLGQLIGSPDRGKQHRIDFYRRVRNAHYLLKHQGLVCENKQGRLVLTKNGKKQIEKVLLKEYSIPPPVIWDGKWHILLFDIRERRRKIRNQLRRLLQGAGFVRLQDSAWVHPYPCDEFVALIRAHLSSGTGELRHITADALESDLPLRDHFHLP